jgi:hypothetical protein
MNITHLTNLELHNNYTMSNRSQWVTFDSVFQVHPSNMKRTSNMPKNQMIHGCLELTFKK